MISTKGGSVGEVVTEAGLDIKAVRQELGLTQGELARMIGFSPRAIQSCEQGWRHPSPALEKMVLLLLMSHRNGGAMRTFRCWEVNDCPPERCQDCITYRCGQGHLCFPPQVESAAREDSHPPVVSYRLGAGWLPR